MDTVVKVWSDEDVLELRSGHWAARLDAQEGGTTAYLHFELERDRDEWVWSYPSLRITFGANGVPLSLLLDRQAWSVREFHVYTNRWVTALVAEH